MKKILSSQFLVAALSCACSVAVAQPVKVDEKLPPYETVSGVSGNLNSIGSDTLNNLMTLWAESFQAYYPNVKIQIEGKGSSTAPPALIENTAQLGPMSRPMKQAEIDAFESKHGYKPAEIKVAIDALAVYVHKDNSIPSLSMKQVDGIFSSTRKSGSLPLATWGDLAMPDTWKSRPLSLYGRNSASGTYGFFKDVALRGGDFKATVKEQPGSSSVVQAVANDLAGIGYSGIGYMTSGVRPLPLSGADGKPHQPSLENCVSGKYPLARFLYIYVNKKPGQPMDKLTSEFIRFILSGPGQEIVVKDGYFPLPAEPAAAETKKVTNN
ncbi:MAG TPA: phosphate ABC transporter substrate-binding protein [Verrucomicrobiae bacterium]|nr:phosphate ABC transporter substrate-binding protein [Verrucomicrobiae bacterium]